MMFKKIMIAAVAALVGSLHPAAVWAQYPEKPIRLIVPFAPGGAADILGRLMANAMQPILGQNIIVENKAGAGGMIGSRFVANAPPDGYTLLLAAAGPTVVRPNLYKDPSFNPVTDLEPITAITQDHNLMAVNPAIAARTVPEFIAYAKKAQKPLSFGSPGVGTPAHLAGELLNKLAGLQMQHVAYKGTGPAVTDLITGHIDVMIDNMPPLLPHAQSGRLRAIAVPSAARARATPDLPTVEEQGLQGYVVMAWKGLMAPKGTPKPILETLHAAVVQALKDPDIERRLTELGADPKGNRPEEFARQIAAETQWWANLIQETNTTLE